MTNKTSGAPLKSAIYEQLARIGHATASPGRLELLDLLAQGPRTVAALAQHTGRSAATTSHHLQVLRRARLVDAQKAGLYVTYRLADLQVGAYLLHLRRLAESHLAEVQQVTTQYLEARGALEAVDNEELVRRVRAGAVTLIDVRPHEEFLAGHIPGAVSMPVSDLKAHMAELPRTRDVVAYCRGPYCVMALDAVALLRRKGFRAQRMEHGVPEWRERGWRVETGRGPRAAARP
jgi:rhodanese-related sulfurtransferase